MKRLFPEALIENLTEEIKTYTKEIVEKKITAEFPESFGRYIEVFSGGASVLFPADRHAKFEVWNDAKEII